MASSLFAVICSENKTLILEGLAMPDSQTFV
jgi:hypothetical protein